MKISLSKSINLILLPVALLFSCNKKDPVLEEYNVELFSTYLTINNLKAKSNQDYEAIISLTSEGMKHHDLPHNLNSVTINNNKIPYNYLPTTGYFKIEKQYIKGDIKISVNEEETYYKINLALDEYLNIDANKIRKGDDLSINISLKHDYPNYKIHLEHFLVSINQKDMTSFAHLTAKEEGKAANLTLSKEYITNDIMITIYVDKTLNEIGDYAYQYVQAKEFSYKFALVPGRYFNFLRTINNKNVAMYYRLEGSNDDILFNNVLEITNLGNYIFTIKEKDGNNINDTIIASIFEVLGDDDARIYSLSKKLNKKIVGFSYKAYINDSYPVITSGGNYIRLFPKEMQKIFNTQNGLPRFYELQNNAYKFVSYFYDYYDNNFYYMPDINFTANNVNDYLLVTYLDNISNVDNLEISTDVAKNTDQEINIPTKENETMNITFYGIKNNATYELKSDDISSFEVYTYDKLAKIEVTNKRFKAPEQSYSRIVIRFLGNGNNIKLNLKKII